MKVGNKAEHIWNEAEQEWTYTGYKIVDGELVKEE